jgi:uroporphyrinogen-III synthase
MHILVTRPESEAPRTKRKLEAMGHRVTVAPVLEIVTETPAIETSGVQALVLTSRNAVHALDAHPQKSALLALPVLAVGKSTAAAARDAGFDVILEGDAGGAELGALIARHIDRQAGTLLQISGEAIAFDLAEALSPAGFDVRRVIVYRSRAAAGLPLAVAASLRNGDLDAVLLMSPRTAETWSVLVEEAGLAKESRSLVHLCLSTGVAEALRRLQPARIEVAVKPNEEEMLALAARLSSSSPNTT